MCELPVKCIATMRWLISRSCLLICVCIATSSFAVDRQRISLDGSWQFRFASDDRGASEHWENSATTFERQLEVPGCWDAQGVGAESEKMRHNAVGVGWYRRTFSIPAKWRGRRIWLCIGGVHRSAVVYINGQKVAEHFGYPVAFRVDITDKLGATQQNLVIAVDSRRHAERDPLYGTFDLPDFMFIDWGGIFEHVWLETTGDEWIEDALVRPDPAAHRAEVQVNLGGTATKKSRVSYSVHDAMNNVLASGESPVDKGATLEIPLKSAPFWTPAERNLLMLELTLKVGDAVADEREIRFGLRKLEAKEGQFVLNGEKVFLRGYGDDFNFPRQLLPPADVKFWKDYLQKRKDFGFNFVRHHSMMPTESYLTAADEVGMLVQPELPIAYMEYEAKATAQGRELYRQVWEGYIRQMCNHPSVASWCMGNEELHGLPFGGDLYRAAKAIDPSRLVIDSDGQAALNSDRPTLDYRPVQFEEHLLPWGKSRGKYVNSMTAKPTVVHEMGNISALPDPTEAKAFDGTIKPFWLDEMAAAVKRQHLESELPAMLQASEKLQASLLKLNCEAARLGPGICGYEQWLFRDYWTQGTGIESIIGTTRGLSADRAKLFNADAVVLWDHDRVNFRCGESISLKIVLSDYRPSGAEAIGTISVGLGDQAKINLTPPAADGGRGAIGPWIGKITAPDVASPVKLMMSVEGKGVHNEWPVWIWPRVPESTEQIDVADRLTSDVIGRLENGARVLLLDVSPFPTQKAHFKPAWWKGDERGDFDYGNYFSDHPSLAGFPNDGYGDLQAYALLEDRAVVNLDEVPGNLQPIVWGIDVPWKLRRMAYLWEARVGKGKLLVCSFDLSTKTRAADPATDWMYSLLTRYVGSVAFAPKVELPIQWLRDRMSKTVPN